MNELADFFSAVVCEIDGAIAFREGVAQRYPDDPRNVRCVEALKALRANMSSVPMDDVSLSRCLKTYKSKHSDAGNEDPVPVPEMGLWFPISDSDLALAGFATKQIFTRYGFDGPESGDAIEFLSDLLLEIESWDVDDLAFDSV